MARPLPQNVVPLCQPMFEVVPPVIVNKLIWLVHLVSMWLVCCWNVISMGLVCGCSMWLYVWLVCDWYVVGMFSVCGRYVLSM